MIATLRMSCRRLAEGIWSTSDYTGRSRHPLAKRSHLGLNLASTATACRSAGEDDGDPAHFSSVLPAGAGQRLSVRHRSRTAALRAVRHPGVTAPPGGALRPA